MVQKPVATVGGLQYLDFDLRIRRVNQEYRAQADGPGGQAALTFALPFSDLEVDNFLLRVGRTRRATRRIDSPEAQAAKTFGERLFDAVFADGMRACLRSSLDEAYRQGGGLRIRLHLSDAPELADLPWEYLYHPALNRFLGLSVETPVVRYLDLPERPRPLPVTPPLRVLAVIANPSDYPRLDVEREWTILQEALEGLRQRGLVQVERLAESQLPALQRRLRQAPCHVLHFVGHGGFDVAARDGVLILEDDVKLGHPVSGRDLGVLLHDHRALRLVVLNACEGARSSRTDPFAGAAQSLVQQGLPAVIAMQFEITDEAAIIFAREFYGAIADGYPVDAALAEARKAIFLQGHAVEWGTPVLHTRTPDGRIFDVDRLLELQPQPPAPAPAVAPPEANEQAMEPAVAGTRPSDLEGFLRSPWGLLAAVAVLLPSVNMLLGVIPVGMWEGEGSGGFAYFSPRLVTIVASLSALFAALWTLNRRPTPVPRSHESPIPPGVLPSLSVGLLALVVYATVHTLVAGDFYFTVLGWHSDNRLRLFGDVLLTGCYSAWFSTAARAVVLVAIKWSRRAR